MISIKFILYMTSLMVAIAHDKPVDGTQINQSYIDFLVADTAEALNLNGLDLWQRINSTALSSSRDPFSILLQLREELQLATNLDALTSNQETGYQSAENSDSDEKSFTEAQFEILPDHNQSNKMALTSPMEKVSNLLKNKIDLHRVRVLVDKWIPAPIQVVISQSFKVAYRVCSATGQIVSRKIWPFLKTQLQEGSSSRRLGSLIVDKAKYGIRMAQDRLGP